MKKIFTLIALAGLATFTACTEETLAPVTPVESENEVVLGAITTNATWTADNIYELASKIVIEDGVTLTIEAGTLIKGRTGTGSLATGLIVARGGKLMAEGTAAKPIIFTSVEDNIKIGELMGSNLTNEDVEKWGGLIILGKAPISAENGDTESQIEGIPASDTFGTYGGDIANDNSGTVKYVSVRHGGALIGDGNEINGITLGGVGSGTTLDYIEVYATLDDGIEFFGGTVNVSNLIISFQQDDGIDMDQNYAGTITNFVVQHGGNSTDEGLEIDGPEGSTNTGGMFTLINGSVMSVGGSDAGTPADLKSKAQGIIENVVFSGYAAGDDLIKIRASYQNNCADAKTDAFTHLTDVNPTLQLVTTEFVDVEVYTKVDGCSVPATDQTASEEATTPSNSATGANAAAFADWTVASITGSL